MFIQALIYSTPRMSRILEALIIWVLSMISLTLSGFIKLQGYIYSTIVNQAALATPPIIYLAIRRDVLLSMLKSLKNIRIKYVVLIALGVWVAGSILTYIQDMFYSPPSWYIEKMREHAPSNISELILALLLTWLLVAPIEELLFRWVLLKPIVDLLGVKMGVISSALIFSFSHLDPWNIISPFLVGLAAGWIVARNGSIISAIIIHGAHNTISHLVNMFIIF
jgi:membrane protease YdiL (CAAX protease family)